MSEKLHKLLILPGLTPEGSFARELLRMQLHSENDFKPLILYFRIIEQEVVLAWLHVHTRLHVDVVETAQHPHALG